jgi:hypothetical protein
MHRTNPFAYAKPITLETLADLFAHHGRLTGGWSMTATPPEPPAGPPAPPANPPAPPADPPAYTPPATQADFDRVIGERVARERAKYADYDDLKAKADAHDAAVEAARSEHEKAVEAARKEGEEVATKAGNARLVASEARALAAQAGFRSLSDVTLLDLSGVKVDDQGVIDSAAIKAKLKELSDAEPWRIDDGKKAPPKPDLTQGGGGGGDNKPGDAGRLAAQRMGFPVS